MNKRRSMLTLGIAAGIAIGYFVKKQVDHYERTSPEQALKNAKDKFKETGPINGSWIYMQPEEVEVGGLKYKAYRGAIMRMIDGKNKQYDFYADLNTGAIIRTTETSQQ